MAEAVYILCALTSVTCAALLIRSYRRTKLRLLLWSTLCFVGLALNNILLFVDLIVVPDMDFALVRSGLAMCSILILLFGLVWESK